MGGRSCLKLYPVESVSHRASVWSVSKTLVATVTVGVATLAKLIELYTVQAIEVIDAMVMSVPALPLMRAMKDAPEPSYTDIACGIIVAIAGEYYTPVVTTHGVNQPELVGPAW